MSICSEQLLTITPRPKLRPKSLTVSVLPNNATDRAYTVTNSNPDVASFDESTSVVTGLKVGTTVITFTANDGSGVTGHCNVTITSGTIVNVESVEILNKVQTLTVDSTYQLQYKVNPDNATNKFVRWNVSDESIATVDENNVLHAVKAGTVTITLQSVYNTQATDTMTVNITSASKPLGCGGSIITASLIISMTSLLGVGLLLLKKKNEQ